MSHAKPDLYTQFKKEAVDLFKQYTKPATKIIFSSEKAPDNAQTFFGSKINKVSGSSQNIKNITLPHLFQISDSEELSLPFNIEKIEVYTLLDGEIFEMGIGADDITNEDFCVVNITVKGCEKTDIVSSNSTKIPRTKINSMELSTVADCSEIKRQMVRIEEIYKKKMNDDDLDIDEEHYDYVQELLDLTQKEDDFGYHPGHIGGYPIWLQSIPKNGIPNGYHFIMQFDLDMLRDDFEICIPGTYFIFYNPDKNKVITYWQTT